MSGPGRGKGHDGRGYSKARKSDGAASPTSSSGDECTTKPKLLKQDWTDTEVAVLVSDLSGFTSTTRKYGIIHFASVIVRMRQLVLPIFERFGALEITTEADNFITVFPTAEDALNAAIEMQGILRKYNASLSEERKHFGVKLNGIGLSCGKGVLLDTYTRLHGTVFRHAYDLGEDVCENGDILVTSSMVEQLGGDANFKFDKHESDECELDDPIYRVDTTNANLSAELVDFHDTRLLPQPLAPFAARHDPANVLSQVDDEIMAQYSQQHTVLMFHLTRDEAASAMDSVRAMERALDVLRPILIGKFEGVECEEELFLFANPMNAVLAVLEARHVIATGGHDVHVEGWGIHHGTMIVVPTTDIHWGDPVNTASKLGQDTASNGDLLISEQIYKLIQEEPEFSKLDFVERQLTVSKVDFTAYTVTRPSASETTTKAPSPGKKKFLRAAERLKCVNPMFLLGKSSSSSKTETTAVS